LNTVDIFLRSRRISS